MIRRSATWLAMILLASAGCRTLPAPTTSRWRSDSMRSPHLFARWEGTLSTRVVYDRDSGEHTVLVLTKVRGPRLQRPTTRSADGVLAQVEEWPLEDLAYLMNADKRLLLPSEAPEGLRVRVDGFSGARDSGKVFNPKVRFMQPARRHPPGPEQPLGVVSSFPAIKVRWIDVIDDRNRERRVWTTDIPFIHL